MLKIYGSMLCPDCVECRTFLDQRNIPYDYRDFSDSLLYLKEFLALRDSDPIFDEPKRAGKIGIPCIVKEDGSVSLHWDM